MHTLKKNLTLSIIYLFMINCSNGLVKITPEWENKRCEYSSIAVLFIPDKPKVNDLSCLKSVYNSNEMEVEFRQYLIRRIKELVLINASCRNVVLIDDSINVKRVEMQIKGKKCCVFNVPTDSLSTLNNKGIDFLLLIEDYCVTITQNSNYSDMQTVPSPSGLGTWLKPSDLNRTKYNQFNNINKSLEQPSLLESHSMKFLLLHCKTGEKVQYGEITFSEDYSLNCLQLGWLGKDAALKYVVSGRINIWSKIIDKLIDNIFKNNPLAGIN